MGSLKTKLITFLIILLPLSVLGQSYNYTYTDPCTKVSKRLTVPFTGGVVVNYFGSVQTFTSNDFSTGVFESWIEQLSQINSSSPCQEVTTTIVNNISNITVSNTLTIVTNIISVSNVAQSLSSIAGGIGNMGGITPQNGTSDSTGTNTQPSTGNQTNQNSQGSQTSNQETGGTNGESQGGNTSNDSTTQGGEQQTESTVDQESSSGGNNLANSLSNAVDGGSSDGGSTSNSGGGGRRNNSANRNAGSLIASGDIVAISNTDQTQNFRFVGSITHVNTKGTRIKGVLFNYTSGIDNLNITFYKSWINKSRKLNTVGAQSFAMDFDKNFFSTTTVLESYKFSKKLTGMFGLNFTAGKMGERELFNLSAVGGGHTTYQINKRISGSVLLLGVYSPFTQFYEGRWWDAGILVVPFNSWDIKITKTFKYNISFTGVYQTGESFLNYQILTGGKLNF